ncbi:hypothetical protein GCM10009682_13970 [Luedemannella flava]|uniref:Uncharacterized protein n=1 Tax=Luedemannella flava TaxID=349316 RepID=A0ABN2LM33_9ACTN
MLLLGVVYAVAMAVAGSMALTAAPFGWVAGAVAASWAVAFVAVSLALDWHVMSVLRVSLLVVSFLATLSALFLVPDALLGVRGVEVSATIVAADETPAVDDGRLLFTLADPAGRTLAGRLEAGDSLTVGDRVTVVADPEGLVHPQLAGDVPGGGALPVGLLLTMYGMVLVLGWLCARQAHRSRSGAEGGA